jgi:hypothetical protein
MTETNAKKARPKPATPEAVTLDPKVTREHYALWEDRFRAVRSQEVAAANVNLTRAVTIALGALTNLVTSRDEILATVTNFRREALDDLRSLAYAVWHADLLYRVASDPSLSCADLMPEAENLRDLMLSQARVQVKRKRFPQAVIDTVEPGSGIEDRANDLVVLAEAFRARWDVLSSKVDLSTEELERADELAAQLLGRLAVRAVPSRKEGELGAGELRARAWTLLLGAYDECRRGAAAVWWYESGGWEQYVPSLRQGQGRGGSRGTREETPDEPVAPNGPTPG